MADSTVPLTPEELQTLAELQARAAAAAAAAKQAGTAAITALLASSEWTLARAAISAVVTQYPTFDTDLGYALMSMDRVAARFGG